MPWVGSVVITTAFRPFAGLSFGSVKPKSAAVRAWLPSSASVIVLSAPDGASFTASRLKDSTAVAVRLPSLSV